MAFLVEATQSLSSSRLYFSHKNKNKIAFYFVLFSFIRISGFAEDTFTRPLDSSRLYFSLKNKNKFAFYFVLYSFIRIFAEQKVLRCVTVAAIS